MHNIDFISEKWRTCRRTRNLAHIHVASSIFPIIYVVVYAEAERRDGDDKKLGAALAALMFNVFQLTRTIMGIVQLNAFVAWCKHALECMSALSGKVKKNSEQDAQSRAPTYEEDVDSRKESDKRIGGSETGALNGLSQLQFDKVLARWKRGVKRLTALVSGFVSPVVDNIEGRTEVNNMVIDNELGGRQVTVLPSWKKMWSELKKGSFDPSRWLRTDRMMPNTVRWSGAFLCSMGGHWGVDKYGFRKNLDSFGAFFSEEMEDVLKALQLVEWNIEMENCNNEILSIIGIGNKHGVVELTGEMCTAYGTVFRHYNAERTHNVDLYSFEFNSLISSYPVRENKYETGNRECVQVELEHSILLTKHLGVEAL